MTDKEKKRQHGAPGPDQSRRNMLRYFTLTAGCFVVPAGVHALQPAAEPARRGNTFSFPQGVASADPQPDAVILWTRVEGVGGPVDLAVQVARDPDYSDIVSETTVSALPELDHTVRVFVTGLDADRFYYYRFIAPDGVVSRSGRTRTAPPLDAERPLNIAVFSCQDYELGYFTAYRRMLLDDEDAPEGTGIDFAMHLGDFIYETVRRPESMAGGSGRGRAWLRNRDGTIRRLTPFPSGGEESGRVWVVPTDLAGYRALYKAYLTDPDLQEARAKYPFVQTWDDHEFKNDYWQSYAEDEPNAELKVVANQAWFEFIPAALSMGISDSHSHHAEDFEFASVENAPANDFDEYFFSLEANNVAAVESMTIYRSLRWGRMAELFMTDCRSYRGPRGFPQELLTVGRHPYPPAPIDPGLIDVLNRGREAHNGEPPDEIEYLGRRMPNPRKSAPAGSMLGGRQKAWLVAGLRDSKARWKLLGLSVGLMRHGFDSSYREDGFSNGIMWTDGWDGYPAERRELTEFIRREGIDNVVSLTGDRHIHMAGLVLDDFDGDAAVPVAAEFAGGAVSATLRLTIQQRIVSHDDELAALVSFDGRQHGYDKAVMPSMNAWMLYGAASARAIHDGMPEEKAVELDNAHVNRHLHYADADAHGYYVARYTADRCAVEFITIEEPVSLPAEGEAPVRRRVRFTVNSWSGDEDASIEVAGLTGERPLGGLRS
jgi:alkaline phosphatase D